MDETATMWVPGQSFPAVTDTPAIRRGDTVAFVGSTMAGQTGEVLQVCRGPTGQPVAEVLLHQPQYGRKSVAWMLTDHLELTCPR